MSTQLYVVYLEIKNHYFWQKKTRQKQKVFYFTNIDIKKTSHITLTLRFAFFILDHFNFHTTN